MEQNTKIWQVEIGSGPIVATAIHDGHKIRPTLRPLLALSEADQLREEDPYTGLWTTVAPTRVIATHSRFQVDLNRPRKKAVYRKPEDAWGLQVWSSDLPEEEAQLSLAGFDSFYEEMERILNELIAATGCFLLLDLHTYCYRRSGRDGPPAEAEGNPEVNIGTGTLDRVYWAPVVDSLIRGLSEFNFLGRRLDVRENVKFKGGNFPRWINETFTRKGCAIAIEFKKFFMDEWTGRLDEVQHQAIREGLQSCIPEVQAALLKVVRK